MGFAYLRTGIAYFCRPTIYRYFITTSWSVNWKSLWKLQKWWRSSVGQEELRNRHKIELLFYCNVLTHRWHSFEFGRLCNEYPARAPNMRWALRYGSLRKPNILTIPCSHNIHSHILIFAHFRFLDYHIHAFPYSHLHTFTHFHIHTFTHSHIHILTHSRDPTSSYSHIHTVIHSHILISPCSRISKNGTRRALRL